MRTLFKTEWKWTAKPGDVEERGGSPRSGKKCLLRGVTCCMISATCHPIKLMEIFNSGNQCLPMMEDG